MKEKSNSILVSVIVPVYNVREYIDVCLGSIVNQTYENLEIILINDGSTDGSDEKCLEWKKQDKRILYIDKKNEGAGPTRNYGIKIASGKYLAFVDSDDWLDVTFIEKMLKAIVIDDADICECDFYRIAVDSGIKSYNTNNGVMGHEFTKAERIIWGSICIWKMITKRELWIKNNVKMPALPVEDLAVYALLIALGEKICCVNEPLYYYRKNRLGSITFNKETFQKGPLAMAYLLDSFKKANLYEKHKDSLYRHILRWTSRYLVACLTKTSKLEYKDFEKIYIDFLEEKFSYEIKSVVTFGSYNLTRIINKLMTLENPYNRFQFMSLVSIMSNNKKLQSPEHNNPYRRYMLNREFRNSFFELLDVEKPEYIAIDFVEERHDLLEAAGSFYTNSDALEQSECSINNGRVISRFSKECKQIWENACDCFIEELKKRFKANNVILVEIYLAEQYGSLEKQNEYEDLGTIRKINNILKTYYDYFAKNFIGIQRIAAFTEALYFTDEKYEYGCFPWHLNELVNQDIAKRINL